ncbi:MAG TPA: transcriptional regulator, partial [Lactobacillus johnsonii]|nr:transcriptional regulator [Lactobacillus johnsonii]
ACILLELKKELRKNEKNSLRQILNSLCSYIQKHKQYFYNA